MRYEQNALDELYDIRDHYRDVEARYDEQHARAIFARSQRKRVDAEIARRETVHEATVKETNHANQAL